VTDYPGFTYSFLPYSWSNLAQQTFIETFTYDYIDEANFNYRPSGNGGFDNIVIGYSIRHSYADPTNGGDLFGEGTTDGNSFRLANVSAKNQYNDYMTQYPNLEDAPQSVLTIIDSLKQQLKESLSRLIPINNLGDAADKTYPNLVFNESDKTCSFYYNGETLDTYMENTLLTTYNASALPHPDENIQFRQPYAVARNVYYNDDEEGYFEFPHRFYKSNAADATPYKLTKIIGPSGEKTGNTLDNLTSSIYTR
jgi:hypothetical protein